MDLLATHCGKLTSRRLDIDLEILREGIATGAVDFCGHCPTELNYADECTKEIDVLESKVEKSMQENLVLVAN